MDRIGDKLRAFRTEKGLPLRIVAAYLDTDPAILSKIETGKRRASREQIVKLAKYFKANENDLLTAWLADKLVYEAGSEKMALEAMKVAEELVEYETDSTKKKKTYYVNIIDQIKRYFITNPSVNRAWVFGSFARQEDTNKSDIDILIDVNRNKAFTLFDIADIKFGLQELTGREIDVVMLNGIRDTVKERIKKDMKLIYET